MFTYQDFLNCQSSNEREAFITGAVDSYTASDFYKKACEAEQYYKGENCAVLNSLSKLNLGSGVNIDLTAAIRSPSGIFKRLITQLIQSIWSYGVTLEDYSVKKRLGPNFDKIAASISKNAAIHGVSYGFWNVDRLYCFSALEYFPLPDERTGDDMAGIRFWRIDENKPMYIQLFEHDGWSEFTRAKDSLTPRISKTPYKLTVRRASVRDNIIKSDNWGGLPIIPMYANEEHLGELTFPIKSKIDLYDFILSGFCDNVLRTRVIYWLLQGFSGEVTELQGILSEIERLGIIAPADNSAVDAKLVDMPFGAVEFALNKLRKDIYEDFMGLDLTEITGGSLTNVAIQTAFFNLSLKISDFEWQAFDFVRKLLLLQGVVTENIKFKKKSISNDYELMRMLEICRADLDLKTAFDKNPLIEPDEVETIIMRKGVEDRQLNNEGGVAG